MRRLTWPTVALVLFLGTVAANLWLWGELRGLQECSAIWTGK